MEKSVNGALNVLFCTQPGSTPLRLARLVDLYADEAEALTEACAAIRYDTAESELAFLSAWVDRVEKAEKARSAAPRPVRSASPAPQVQHLRPDLQLRFHPAERRLELSGAGLTDALRADLSAWLTQKGKSDAT